MIPTASDVARRFGKRELLQFCEELEMEVDASTHVYGLVEMLTEDMNENGVPVLEDVSERFAEYLVYMQYYTGTGEFVATPREKFQVEDTIEEKVEEDLPEELPECFGWGEPEWNGNCKRCPIQEACVRERDRLTAEMPCFGTYDETDEACQECTIWRVCKQKQNGES